MQIHDITLPGKSLKLAPIGDFQYGAAGCDVQKLKRHIAYGVKNAWHFLGMGDYLDHFSPSNKKALVAAKGSLYESAVELLDDAVKQRCQKLVDEVLHKSAGRWIGLVHGDHIWDFNDGYNSDAWIADELGAQYLGTAAIVRISLGGAPKAPPLKVLVTHGRGSSVSSTGKTLHLERLLTAFDVDVVLMGHSHLKYGFPVDKLKAVTMPDGSAKLVNETKILGITGSFYNGYQQGQKNGAGLPTGSYPEHGAMRPIPTGGILIDATPKEEDWGWRWDMMVTA
jgi:hypothetical protein